MPEQFITRPVEELFGRHPGYGFAGFGVSTAIGNYTETAVDLGFPGGLLGLLDMARTYNSLSTAAQTIGPGWAHSYAAGLQPGPAPGLLHHTPSSVTFTDVDGRVLTFTPNPAGGFNRAQDLDADLVRNADGSYALTYNSGAVWAFDANGRAVSRSLEGQSVTYDYDGSGALLRAGHSSGLNVSLSYDGNGRLTRAESSDGRVVAYAYAADGTLTQVTAPDGGVTRYATVDGAFQVTDADGNVVVSNTPATGAVAHQDLPTGGHADFGYDSSAGATTVTSQSGAVITFQADVNGRMTKVTDPNANSATFGYDGNGYLAEAVSPAGTRLAQAHDARGNLLTSTFGGATTSYAWDTSDRATSVNGPTGGTVGYGYSGDSSVPSQVTDQVGATTHFESANGLVTAVTDADGNTTSYAYDANGNLISQTDAAGNVTQFRYDTAGRRTAEISPSGATTSYAYDPAGRVTAVTDPLGNVTKYGYSAAGRLLTVTDPTGAVTTHAYDTAGQLTSVSDPLGRVTSYAYDPDGNLTRTTAPGGAATTTEYDHAGRVTAVTDPLGNTTRNDYDADGNLVAVTDPLGNITRRAYDARGNLTEVTDPAGGRTVYAYDAEDREISVTDPDGGQWLTSYNAVGRVVATTDPGGGVRRHEWTPGGRESARVDPLGRVTRYTYTPTNLPLTVTDPQGGTAVYSYDADGRRVSDTSAARLTNRYRWDAASNMVAAVDPRGWITRYEYNPRGQQIAQISPSGAVTRYRYDAAGQCVETVDANDSPTVFGYDDAGHLTEVTDPKGGVTRYGYDAAGQQISRTDPLGRTSTRGYDAAGNLISFTDPAGHVQHLAYDAARRLIQHTADDAAEVTYGYDPYGRRTSMTDVTGTTRYAYSPTGRPVTVTYPDGAVTTAAYDAAGQRTSLTYASGLVVSYRYDLNGNLVALRDSRAGEAVYALDPDGRLLTEQLPGRLARRYRYDRDVLARFTVIRDGHPVYRTSFRHDPDGRISAQRDDEHLTRFAYDPAGQLTDIIREDLAERPGPRGERRQPQHQPQRRPAPGPRPESGEWHLSYDVLGNRSTLRHRDAETRYHYDAASQLLAAETRGRRTEYRYDGSGRLTEEREGDRQRAISYDGFGLPASVSTTRPGFREQSQPVFDGNGLLAALTRTTERGESGEQRAARVRYRWNTAQTPDILTQLAEPRLDDAERDRPGRLDADFAYGYGRTFASSEHEAATFRTDAFDSAIRTEETEPWAQAERYDPFGSPEGWRDEADDRPRESDGPQLPRFGFRGELALGPLVYLRARTYDSQLGRFTTPDPLAAQPKQAAAVSPYLYGGNDPVNNTDALGLFGFGSLFSDIKSAVKHVVSHLQHTAHAVAGTISRAAHVVAGAAAHAFETVHSVLVRVAENARKDAGRIVRVIHDAATRVVTTVRDAVSRSVGIVRSSVNDAVTWIKKHNQVIGKIGSFLGNISGKLALAGAIIAPIPGLDALTPVLEVGALATSIGALTAQGVAKAAGDRNVTYGDLLGDALGAIPGGGDTEDLEEGVGIVSRIADDGSQDAADVTNSRDALGRFTSSSGGDSEAAAAGRSAHENYEHTLGGGDYVFNKTLPGDSLDRPDAYSMSERIVRELKSDNPDSIAKGWRQVKGYKQYLEDYTGESWTAYVDVYKA
jgi:RHS repeat-associated protein